MGLILIVVLVILLIGALPAGGYSYFPSGGVGAAAVASHTVAVFSGHLTFAH